MRHLKPNEKRKRGCMFCADMVKDGRRHSCPYAECPYHELDGFDSYSQYLKQKGILSCAQLRTLLKSVTSCD